MRAILTYHSIDRSGSPVSVDPDTFGRHLQSLAAAGIPVVPVADLLARGGDGVAITFDDGFANFATEAWPRLADQGFPVTVFIPTAHVGGSSEWNARLGLPVAPLLDWDGLGALAGAGVAIESHGRTHRALRRLSDLEIRDELGGAADDLTRRLNRRPEGLAYPFGACDARVAAIAGEWARWACTTTFGPVDGGDPLRTPRLDAHYFRGGDFAGWTGPGFRAGMILIRVRRSVGALTRKNGWA